jgi:hypothetical protein
MNSWSMLLSWLVLSAIVASVYSVVAKRRRMKKR